VFEGGLRVTTSLRPADQRLAETAVRARLAGDYCSLVLGTENLTPLELAGAYATLANGGVHCRPELVTRITGPTGRVLFDGRPACRRVLDPRVAATAVGILRGVVGPGGTGFRAAIGRPLAGKTGTTSGYGDAWFTGFTPQLATSVWVGDARAQVPMRALFGAGPAEAAGPRTAVP
jgi:membrane peptidoglycan carboxypeptidase